MRLPDLERFEDAALLKAKIAACLTAFVSDPAEGELPTTFVRAKTAIPKSVLSAPFLCPLCRTAGRARFTRKTVWLDWRTGRSRRSTLCEFCSPRDGGPSEPPGLCARQRAKRLS